MQVVSNVTAVKICEIGAGQGRNSKVYLAEDPQLGGQIALKQIPLSGLSPTYFDEAQHLYLSRHPRVVPIMYASQDAANVYMAMPYFPNGSLQGYLDTHGVPTVKMVIKWAQELLEGLHHVHSLGLVHFDVKPTNVFLANNGAAMVADFGQAAPVNSLGVAVQPRIYCLHWPPEVLIYGAATKQADIYQVGVTLYRLCAGNDLFNTQVPPDRGTLETRILAGLFPNRQLFLSHIPNRLRRVIRTALQVDPANRYQTALEMADALGQVEKLLDWSYTSTADGARWVRATLTHRYTIEVTKAADGLFHVEGYVVNLASSRSQKRSAWCGGPFRTRKQADRCVEKVFRGDERP